MRNRMVKGKRAGIAAMLAAGLAALLLITACAPRPPTEEKQVVTVGMIAGVTGPIASAIQISLRNNIDYFRYFEEVGIPGVTLPPGVTIELIWGDSGFDIPRAISVYERMRERNVLFYFFPAPTEVGALKSRLERDAVPAFTIVVSEDLIYPPGWVFSVYPTESEKFVILCDWIMRNWEEERPPRVALMGIDTESGRAAEVMGSAYAKSIGIEMLPFEVVPLMPVDVVPQLLRLHEGGADFVYMTVPWFTAVPIMKDAERLGVTDEIRFGGYENSQAIQLLELGLAAEGYFCPRGVPWYKEVPFLIEMFNRYEGGKIDTAGDAASNLLWTPAIIEAIRIAIEDVGYENLNGRVVKEAMYNIKDFDPHGLGTKRTWTPEDHRGAPQVRIYEVQGGEVLPITDWQDAPMLVPGE